VGVVTGVMELFNSSVKIIQQETNMKNFSIQFNDFLLLLMANLYRKIN